MDKYEKDKTPSDPLMDKVFQDEKYGKLMLAIDTARTHLDSMKEGDKTNLKDLAEKVAQDLGVSITQVGPFVNMAVQTYEGITVSRGRYGGIFKGIKVKKEDDRERCVTCGQAKRRKRIKTGSSSITTILSLPDMDRVGDSDDSDDDEVDEDDDLDDDDGNDNHDLELEDDKEDKSII